VKCGLAAACLALAALLAGCGGTAPASVPRPQLSKANAPRDAQVSGRLEVCSLDDSPCAPGDGSIYAVDVKHRVVATGRVVRGRFSLLLHPGRYMLHANQRYGWCLRYRSCNVYRAVLAVAHQPLRVELDVPPPPSARCTWHGTNRLPGARAYHDPAGWRIEVPHGWHVLRFSSSAQRLHAAGAEISPVRLPAPRLVARAPIQASGLAVPPRSVGLVIATDTETGLVGESRGYIKKPPLPAPSQCGWSTGSALAGQPYIEILWFEHHGKRFVATVKVGAKANGSEAADIDLIIRSLRFPGRR
jgi:hypothetical protein